MTIRQFLKRLAQERWRKWHTDRSGRIRAHGGRCPISVLAGLYESEYDAAAKELGISDNDVIRIVQAADLSFPPKPNQPLRRRILEAVGLRKTA